MFFVSDITKPTLFCPRDVVTSTDTNSDVATVTWRLPLALDNSGALPIVTSLPVLYPPSQLGIGNVTMTYVAEDQSGNKGRCRFTISVQGWFHPPSQENPIELRTLGEVGQGKWSLCFTQF